MVDYSRDYLRKLPAIQLRWLPVALDEFPFRGDKFVQQLTSQKMIEWRAKSRDQAPFFDKPHFRFMQPWALGLLP